MNCHDWDETARGLADYVGQFGLLMERGAIGLQLDSSQLPIAREELPVVVAVFGNDNASGRPARREVESVRHQVEEADLQELGFAVSQDGSTWALLVGSEAPFHTEAARIFRRELIKTFLEEAVWGAWQNVNEGR